MKARRSNFDRKRTNPEFILSKIIIQIQRSHKAFLRQTKIEMINCQKTYFTRNVKRSTSGHKEHGIGQKLGSTEQKGVVGGINEV